MIGHGAKFGRKKEDAIIALLTHRTVEEAARAVKISPKTLLRLLYWTEQMGKLVSGELTRETLPSLIPLDAFRAVMKACYAGEVDSPYARIICAEGSGDQE